MRKKIEAAIEYLKKISLREPADFRIEEIEGNRIVLSYKDDTDYMYEQRIYKEFIWSDEQGQIISMKHFKI